MHAFADIQPLTDNCDKFQTCKSGSKHFCYQYDCYQSQIIIHVAIIVTTHTSVYIAYNTYKYYQLHK